MDSMLTREQITDVYDASLEDWPSAGRGVKEALRAFHDAIDDYGDALTYETFLFAYVLGYGHGRAAGMEGGASHE